MSTFHGLEMAKQALFAQQSALYTTGHNISNANTEGYTRQRVNFETMPAYPSASRNRPEMPGQFGTGVDIAAVDRLRDKFLDMQYRTENSKAGFWEAKAAALDRLERLMNEPSESGLSQSMKQFWQSLQDLSTNPDNSGAKSVVAQRGQALADAFNYTADSLESIRDDLKAEINHHADKVNSLVRSINRINEQIKQIEPHGYIPNDLYDDRDRMIDELSEIVNIRVDHVKSGDSSPDHADGLVTITLADEHGKPIDGATLVDAEGHIQEIDVDFSTAHGAYEVVTGVRVGEDTFEMSQGSLKGNIEAYGYLQDGQVTGIYTNMLNDLDQMTTAFTEAFNRVYLGEDEGANRVPFFEIGDANRPAATVRVHATIIDAPETIIASQDGYGDLASRLADVFDEELADLDDTSTHKFFESLIGRLGVDAQEANTMKNNTDVLRSQVDEQRMSVSSVSLDEEMTNMIKFQHAYSAAARSMTAIDEMIDRLINNMGLVGR
ncbi:MAG TPA: flagellar hook-associated protein FlgK [Bacillota bacterium]|nr:flagellar hook-associated protein FlgK [Bacillota bacterium]